jgi:hypothetical protein
VNKLRDQLGVKVDVSDEVDEKEKEAGGKKKKAVHHQKSKVKVSIPRHLLFLSLSSVSFVDYRQEGKCRGS